MKAARLLSERKKEIGEIICAECGKPIGESITEVVRAAGVLDYLQKRQGVFQGMVSR